MEERKYIIFECSGGIGKNILATAVVEALKKKYNDYSIIVVTAWEEAWFHNPNVYRVYKFGYLNYFFDDFVNEQTKIFKIDPYHCEDYILGRKHLIKVWCELCGVEYQGEKPFIHITPKEHDIVKDKLKLDNRKILLIQTNGGGQQQHTDKSWARDMPQKTAQDIVNNAVNIGYRVIHVKREDQPQLDNVENAVLSFREQFALAMFSHKRLLIDSFMQHVCAALELPSVVLWSVTQPELIGYDIHTNIKPKVEYTTKFDKYSYLERFDITGAPYQFPYNTLEIFDIFDVWNKLELEK